MMKNINFIIVSTLIIGFLSVNSQGKLLINRKTCIIDHQLSNNDTGEIDLLTFQQVWSPAFCYQLSQKKSHHSSQSCNNTQWLIAQLESMKKQNIVPLLCNCSIGFNATQLSSIMTDLEINWININHKHLYLNYQWIMHGTCGAKVDGIENQFNYFNKSLDLLEKFNMHRILSNATINPGSKYPTTAIKDTLLRKLGKRAELVCFLNKTTHEFYLAGVRLCFDASFNLENCKNEIKQHSNHCPENEELIYLDSIPH